MEVRGPAPLALAVLFVLCPQQHVSAQKPLTPKDAAKLVAEADKLAAEGKMLDARQRYALVVEQDPTNVAVAFKLARTCETLREWACAASAYGVAARASQGAERGDAYAGLAAVHLRRSSYAQAAEAARQALSINPTHPSAVVTLAYSLVREGKIDEGRAAAEKAVDISPSNALAHIALGEALLAGGRPGDAEAALRKAIEVDPRSAEAYAALAEIQYRRGDLDQALASASRAFEFGSGFPRLYLVRARVHDARGNATLALADAQMALTASPDDAEAHLLLAQLQRKQGGTGVAIDHYRKALALDPKLGTAALELGELLAARGETAEATRLAETAVELLPQSARAYRLVATLYEQAKRLDEALDANTRAVELDPSLAAAHHARGRLLREHKKDAAAAVASLEKAVALSPDNAEFLTDLGVALYEAKQPERAIELIRRAAGQPDYRHPMGFAVLGLALKDTGRFDEAIGWFEKAAALSPKWWLPHWGAAWSHFGLIKKGCPCGPEDEEHVKRMKAHFDEMVARQGKDPDLEQRLVALLKGQKVK